MASILNGSPPTVGTPRSPISSPVWNNATAAMSWKFHGIYTVGSTTPATAALSCARRRGTLSSRQADDSPEVHPFPHQGHGKRTNGLEGQGGSFLVKSRRQSPRRLPPHLGLQRAASRRRKMVPRLGPTRRRTRNLAARRFRTLARRTHAGGHE